MMQCNVKRDLFTSLVGTVPLADVLTDLPLPSPLPTPMEETVLGKMKLSDESKKLLDSSNPVLCSRITEALLAVDTSFLDVKDSAQTVPYTPNAKDPPLIKVVMNNLLPQAVVRIEKLDPGLYNSPTKNVSQPIVPGTDKSLDAVVPSHVAKESHSTKKRKEKKRSQLSSSGSATPVSSSSVSETKALKKSRRLSSSSDETAPPRKKKHPRPLLSESPESLHVSIDCHSNLVTPETSKSLKQKQRTKNRGSSKSAGTRIQNNPAPRLPPLSTEELIVRVSRARLKGDFKLPYSGEVHGGMYREGGLPTERPLHRVGVQAVDVRNDRWAGKEEAEFAMAPGVSDRATNDEIKKVHKKKKKHSHHHHRGDQAKLAVLRRFTNMVDGLFDQNTSEDDLFNRMTLSEILSQVSSLKQQGILHEVIVWELHYEQKALLN